jgi:alpha-L-fucosidase
MQPQRDRFGDGWMHEAEWFRQQRYGMFIHLNIATVPAFAPVQEYSDWYWAFWADPPLPDIAGHPSTPLPEVLAWHREHFGEITRFDDFIDLLTMQRFDAGAITDLAREAGMRYVVPVTKHHDGYCWWDSALTDRTSARTTPSRDVIAELADASRARDLTFGVYHSILDWSHPDFPDTERFVRSYLHPQVRELVERFQPATLWGDGHWGQAPHHWRAQELMDECRATLADAGVDLMVNDRWGLAQPDFVTYEYDVPDTPPDGPWELCRGISHSFCFNRAEEDDDHLTPHQIVDLLTEVVAKGGNLLLNIGPRADGTVPEVQADTLRRSGAWVNANADVIHGSERFDVWGDDTVRYTAGTAGTAPDGQRRVNVIDLAREPARSLAHFSPHRYPVRAVHGAIEWNQDERGLHVRWDPNESDLAAVYRVDVEDVRDRRLAVKGERGPGTIVVDGRAQPTIGAALEAASPGSLVQLGAGRYGPAEQFPLSIPAGVTLAGTDDVSDVVLDAGGLGFGVPAVQLRGDGSAVEGVTITGIAEPYFMLAAPAVVLEGGDGAAVRNCAVHGSIVVFGGSDAEIAWNDVQRGNISSLGGEAVRITGNHQSGFRWGAGIDVNDGAGHRIDANQMEGDLCGIRVRRATDVRVAGNQCTTRWWGGELDAVVEGEVSGNRLVRTMRAVAVDGGRGNRVVANVAERCDTGVLVEHGAEGTEITANRLDRCRVGVLVWSSPDTEQSANTVTGSRDHDLVTGP